MYKKIKRLFDVFQQTLIEANYHPEPRSLWSVFKSKDEKLPETAEVAMGNKMIKTSGKIGGGFIWAPLMGLASLKLQMTATVLSAIAGGALAVAGAGLFTLEYIRSKRAREEIITEVNFAGQKVQGRRADLCRLHQAQSRIMNLASSFKMASLESTADTIQGILDCVREERTRVKILDNGPHGAGDAQYEFSRPAISLLRDKDIPPCDAISAAAIPPLHSSWKKSADRALINQITELHRALPPHIRLQVERNLKKTGSHRRARPKPD